MKLREKTFAFAALAIVVCIPFVFGAWDGWQRGVFEDKAKNELLQAHGAIANLRNEIDATQRELADAKAACDQWEKVFQNTSDRAAMWLAKYNEARKELPSGWIPPSERPIEGWVDSADLPEGFHAQRDGAKFPRIIIEGQKLTFDAADKHYHYPGLGPDGKPTRAIWLQAGKVFMLGRPDWTDAKTGQVLVRQDNGEWKEDAALAEKRKQIDAELAKQKQAKAEEVIRIDREQAEKLEKLFP